jgi:hypothetical protein
MSRGLKHTYGQFFLSMKTVLPLGVVMQAAGLHKCRVAEMPETAVDKTGT